ncbi:UNKNOWN [Stylonychia lemnae]|uniref:Uncharacterized protein n=1 Tax=Stylonychia lemnae TaxID=5949 RepID=A0A078A909_STYLE|nr:UNKNOWN [Stylonychia lemnae]|eukprot:CDW77288.1 UNKNOWN [Stylonychia lemnae]
MGQCVSDSKTTAERFEVEKQFEVTVDPAFSQKCQKPEVERHLQQRQKRNIRQGLGVNDDSKSVNIIQY